MTQHPWGVSTPEINATVIETGSTGATWVASAEAWMGLGTAALTAAEITGAQMMASFTSISGIRSMLQEAATPPFLAWLGTMAGIAFKQATIHTLVAESYGVTRATMIPSMQSINNRVREAAAEASNIFGQNTPLIVALNAEYASYTMQNATLGTTYGQVITAATMPVPIPPPPPLSSAAKSAADAAAAMGQAGQMASQAGSQGASQAAQQASSAINQGGAANPTSAMGQFGQMFSAPLQMLQSAGGGMSNPLQSMQGLLSAPMQMFGQASGLGQFFNGGSTGDAFMPLSAGMGGGLPLGPAGLGAGAGGGLGAGGGGGIGGVGGGLGGVNSLAGRADGYSAAGGRSSVLSGVTSPGMLNQKTVAMGGPAGMPMAPGSAAASGNGGDRDRGSVVTASASPVAATASVRREMTPAERALFS